MFFALFVFVKNRILFYGRLILGSIVFRQAPPDAPPPLLPLGGPIRPSKSPVSVDPLEFVFPAEQELQEVEPPPPEEEELSGQVFDFRA